MELYILVNQLANKQRRAFERLSYQKHCSPSQGRVLHFLLNTDREPIFQKDIEAEFGMRAPSVTALLRSMEENGLVIRESAAGDARCKQIIPTEKAASYRDDLQTDMETVQALMTAGISEEELDVWEKVSRQIIKNLEGAEKK